MGGLLPKLLVGPSGVLFGGGACPFDGAFREALPDPAAGGPGRFRELGGGAALGFAFPEGICGGGRLVVEDPEELTRFPCVEVGGNMALCPLPPEDELLPPPALFLAPSIIGALRSLVTAFFSRFPCWI